MGATLASRVHGGLFRCLVQIADGRFSSLGGTSGGFLDAVRASEYISLENSFQLRALIVSYYKLNYKFDRIEFPVRPNAKVETLDSLNKERAHGYERDQKQRLEEFGVSPSSF